MNKIRNKIKTLIRDALEHLKHLERQIAYRTYEKYHTVKTDLVPGYRDIDERMLHACFSLLVDFVEIECASMNWELDDEVQSESRKTKCLKAFKELWPFNMILPPVRSIGKGIDYLNWRINLNIDEFISHNSEDDNKCWGEIKELYIWWKCKRPFREEPYEASGCAEFERRLVQIYNNDDFYFGQVILSDYEKRMWDSLKEKMCDIENGYLEEDKNNLLKLISLREYLWS